MDESQVLEEVALEIEKQANDSLSSGPDNCPAAYQGRALLWAAWRIRIGQAKIAELKASNEMKRLVNLQIKL